MDKVSKILVTQRYRTSSHKNQLFIWDSSRKNNFFLEALQTDRQTDIWNYRVDLLLKFNSFAFKNENLFNHCRFYYDIIKVNFMTNNESGNNWQIINITLLYFCQYKGLSVQQTNRRNPVYFSWSTNIPSPFFKFFLLVLMLFYVGLGLGFPRRTEV